MKAKSAGPMAVSPDRPPFEEKMSNILPAYDEAVVRKR
jgi:hypothetical protein